MSKAGVNKMDEINDTLLRTKDQVKNTIDHVLERETKINTLQEHSEALHEQGKVFQQNAKKVRRRMCCKNAKQKLLLSFMCVVILGIVYFAFIHKHVMDAVDE